MGDFYFDSIQAAFTPAALLYYGSSCALTCSCISAVSICPMKSTPTKVILVSSLLAVVGMFSIPGAAFAYQRGVHNDNLNSANAADDLQLNQTKKEDGKKGKGKGKKKGGKKKKEAPKK